MPSWQSRDGLCELQVTAQLVCRLAALPAQSRSFLAVQVWSADWHLSSFVGWKKHLGGHQHSQMSWTPRITYRQTCWVIICHPCWNMQNLQASLRLAGSFFCCLAGSVAKFFTNLAVLKSHATFSVGIRTLTQKLTSTVDKYLPAEFVGIHSSTLSADNMEHCIYGSVKP